MTADHADLRAKIPRAFWDELHADGVIHAEVAIPPSL